MLRWPTSCSRSRFSLSWRKGWDCRFATGHAASPLRPSNRDRFRNLLGKKRKWPHKGAISHFGGERGIRTLGTVLPYTRFPGEHLKPLSHLSVLRNFCRTGRRVPCLDTPRVGTDNGVKFSFRFRFRAHRYSAKAADPGNPPQGRGEPWAMLRGCAFPLCR